MGLYGTQGPRDPLRLACRGASGLAATALLVLLLHAAPLGTLAQGLRFAPGRLGASVVQESITNWKSILNQATTTWSGPNWQAARTSSRCADRGSATLCGVDISNTAAANKAALLVAASPAAYDTRVSDQVGGFAAAPAPRDQYDCNACVAMAVAAAADAAVAMALGRANPGPLISARCLFFCADASSAGPNCGEGWELVSALNGLEKRKGIPTDACLPFLDSDTLSRLSDQGRWRDMLECS
jgi:hypothetical protein